MVVVLVSFAPPEKQETDVRGLLEATAPRYREIDGLRRKYFIGSDDAAGGVYEWADLESAERYFDGAWEQRMLASYGAAPTVKYFHAPCLVDNVSGEIIYSES